MSTESHTDKDHNQVVLFIRAPQHGHVKTRLAQRLGHDRTLALYRCFVADIITTLKDGSYQPSVFFTPEDQVSQVQAWLGGYAHCYPQIGPDLGQRMHSAFMQTLSDPVKRAVLIGSDSPDLDMAVIQGAFAALQENDMVIGPAEDGGYYLIGFQKDTLNANVFNDIAWGTNQVYQQTLRQIQHANLKYHILPTWQDIDTFDDLVAFYARNKISRPGLQTIKYLTRIRENLERQTF